MSNNQYNALARFLNSEKRAFEEPQMMVLPVKTDPYTGKMGFGHSMLTESLVNGFRFPGKVLRGEVPILADYGDGRGRWSPQMIQGATDTAGLAMTGAIGMRGHVPAPRDPLVDVMPPPPRVSSYPLEPGTGRPTKDARLYPEGIYPSDDIGLFGRLNRKGMELSGPPEVRNVPVADIVPSQPPREIDKGFVKQLADEGIRFDPTDPPMVYEYGGRYYLMDGHHRTAAAQMRGDEFLQARVRGTAPIAYSNPKEGAAAAQMTGAGQREDDALMQTLMRYGLLY